MTIEYARHILRTGDNSAIVVNHIVSFRGSTTNEGHPSVDIHTVDGKLHIVSQSYAKIYELIAEGLTL